MMDPYNINVNVYISERHQCTRYHISV